MVNFGPLTAEICCQVWGIPANFNGFRVLASLLHGTLVLDCSQTLPRSTEDATYIRQGGHHVGHWPTFLVIFKMAVRLFSVAEYFEGEIKLLQGKENAYHLNHIVGFHYTSRVSYTTRSNATNIRERKTWTQSGFCNWQNSIRG